MATSYSSYTRKLLHFVKPLQNQGEHICHGQKSAGFLSGFYVRGGEANEGL